MSKAIRVEGLVKRYGDFAAVDNVSFDVSEGEVFGILGPNGAGKTTTLEIIEGLQPPTSGQVTVLGKDIRKQARHIKARIGVQLQSSAYFSFLTLREILNLLGSFYPKRLPPDELLGLVGLADRANSRVNQLSIGQSQRFTVAASLINDPELVILDEPTTGLDPQARHNLWDLISEMHARKVTVVLTTHYMEEAELLCQRLAIMDHGKVVAIDSPSDLISRIETTYTVKLQTDRPLSDGQSHALNEGGSLQQMDVDPQSQPAAGNSYVLRLDRNPESLNRALDGIVRSGISLKHLEIQPATLEDVFLELTGNELRD
ncbi:MAG: ABC transporter ATP-binding protein [Chloroflexota bacterium]|nr:ABC transporter ATP-binding protein [Chloroflexota bacterium]